MRNQIDLTADIMNRLQERESEQMLILSICKAISESLTKDDFHKVVSGLLKETFRFDDFIIASKDDDEIEYQIFSHYSQVKSSVKENYFLNDGFFNVCLNSAETVVFDLKSMNDKKNNCPNYIKCLHDKGLKNGIGLGLPYIKGSRNVLFLFFKNSTNFSRESNRIIRGIAMQLSISIKNILMIDEYESKIANLKILGNNSNEIESQNFDSKSNGFLGILGNSNAMQNIYELITNVAATYSTVLISGETGTGKELVATTIHDLSAVAKKRMIKVNCASIPENLIESELFGHEKGAFTGATDLRIGKFEQAENSTIFLDEIGELPLELQGKLLRVLQEKEIERIGGNKTIKINARIIAATNRSLEKEVAEGRFRNDLYYRLNVYPILLPALRERPEDIVDLANFFLEKHSKKSGKKIKVFLKSSK